MSDYLKVQPPQVPAANPPLLSDIKLEHVLQTMIQSCNREAMDKVVVSDNVLVDINQQIKELEDIALGNTKKITDPNEFQKKLAKNILQFNKAQLQQAQNALEKIYNQLLGLPDEIENGDQLRNINSFEYLRNFAAQIPQEFLNKRKIGNSIFLSVFYISHTQYNQEVAYGDLYTKFLSTLEKRVDVLFRQRDNLEKRNSRTKDKVKNFELAGKIERVNEEIKKYDGMIDQIYNNRNLALQRSYSVVKVPLSDKVHTAHHHAKKIVVNRLTGDAKSPSIKNHTTPQKQESNLIRIFANFGPHFKPQMTTSQASLRIYNHQTANSEKPHPKEYRFGTQGQFINYRSRLSPLFRAWLEKLGRDPIPPSGISHIYFNNLPYSTKFSLRSESNLTAALHAAEKKYPYVAFITLPADGGILNRKKTKSTHKNITYAAASKAMFDSLTLEKKDFFMSRNIENKVFNISENVNSAERQTIINNKIQELLAKSFTALGFSSSDLLSEAEQQAVFFHLVKYELTTFIIDTLKPHGINFSCKDAIDRGGVSSAYYNLITSIENGTPMSRDEFECALHGAPTLVKGRPMNEHIKHIWNTVNVYIEQQDRSAEKAKSIPEWLRAWRLQHALPHTKYHYLNELKKIEAESNNQSKSHASTLGLFTQKSNVKQDNAEALKQLTEILQNLEVKSSYLNVVQPLNVTCTGELNKVVRGLEQDEILRFTHTQPVFIK